MEHSSIMLTHNSKQNFWIFQANPDRFDASHWWHDMGLSDQWQINKHYRGRIRKMGIIFENLEMQKIASDS